MLGATHPIAVVAEQVPELEQHAPISDVVRQKLEEEQVVPEVPVPTPKKVLVPTPPVQLAAVVAVQAPAPEQQAPKTL